MEALAAGQVWVLRDGPRRAVSVNYSPHGAQSSAAIAVVFASIHERDP